MLLSKFAIKNYKIIDDTEPVKVDPKVTALVGKNESGKTAIMKSLWKTKNVAGVKFDKLYDYPRDRYSRERDGTQEVTHLEFTLTPNEIKALVEVLSETIGSEPSTVTVMVTTHYEGQKEVRSDYEVEWDAGEGTTGLEAVSAIKATAKALAPYGPGDVDAIQQSASILTDQIDKASALWEPATVSALELFHAAVTEWKKGDKDRETIATDEQSSIAALIKRGKQGDPLVVARKWAEQNLPNFIYFDDGQLPIQSTGVL